MELLSPSSALGEVKALLESDQPGLTVRDIKLSYQGFDNGTYEVNGEWMFRFAKEDWHRPKFASETAVLRFLKGKTRVRIPEIEFEGKSHVYSGYRKIPGERLGLLWPGMSKAQQEKATETLAGFLFELHSSLDAAKAKELHVRSWPFHWRPMMEQLELLKKCGSQPWKDFALKALMRYEGYLKDPGPLFFLHHDLHGDNVLLDPETRQVSGVIDFGDLCVGDLHRDFFSMQWVSLEASELMIRAYGRLSGCRLDRRRIHDLRSINLLCDLTQSLNQHLPEAARFERDMAQWAAKVHSFSDSNTR